jgi:hypothetical protein
MQCLPMDPLPATALTKADCEAIVRNLDACLAILDQNAGRRPLIEIKLKNMIALLRDEMSDAAETGATVPPFAF